MDPTVDHDDHRPQIVMLNGPSSVGKTTVAKAIQAYALKPFMHVQMDDFLAMMPSRLSGHKDGLVFERIDHQTVEVRSGPFVKIAMIGMRHAIASMAQNGCNIVVDDVFLGNEDAEYRMLLDQYDLHLVGLFASKEVIYERERARGDREIGLAKAQFDRVHQGRQYDLEIDVSRDSPDQIAKQICEALSL